MKRLLIKLSGAFLTSFIVNGCLIDPDHPCGENFVEADDGSCKCPPDRVPIEGSCVACGKNESVIGSDCVCDDGYQQAPTGDGCLPADDCEGACTCSVSTECGGGQLCDVYDTEQCIPPPDGLGEDCSTDADCADTDATYCEIFSTRTCQVEGCAEQAGVCPGDMACCDFAILGRSLCIPADGLEEGACPAPGTLVMRETP